MFRVRTKLDTGHDEGLEEDDSPDGHYETVEFETEAEARAYILGVNAASEATNGWTEGWLEAEYVGEVWDESRSHAPDCPYRNKGECNCPKSRYYEEE